MPLTLRALNIVGCDVSMRTLDLFHLDTGNYDRIPNTADGWSSVLAALPVGTIVCMEATGSYFLGFATACVGQGLDVRVVNPWQVKAFAEAGLSRSKTDKVDARLLAEFCQVMLPKLWPWRPLPDSLAAVVGLVRLADGVRRQKAATLNRVHALRVVDDVLLDSATDLAGRLAAESDALMQKAQGVAQSCQQIGPWYDGLQGLAGLGPKSSLKVLAYSGDIRRFKSARQYAAFTGLPPKTVQSGDSAARHRMGRRGSRELRSVYYWAAVSTIRTESEFGIRYRKMVEGGKRPKVALVAVANRLARAAWCVVRDAELDAD